MIAEGRELLLGAMCLVMGHRTELEEWPKLDRRLFVSHREWCSRCRVTLRSYPDGVRINTCVNCAYEFLVNEAEETWCPPCLERLVPVDTVMEGPPFYRLARRRFDGVDWLPA